MVVRPLGDYVPLRLIRELEYVPTCLLVWPVCTLRFSGVDRLCYGGGRNGIDEKKTGKIRGALTAFGTNL